MDSGKLAIALGLFCIVAAVGSFGYSLMAAAAQADRDSEWERMIWRLRRPELIRRALETETDPDAIAAGREELAYARSAITDADLGIARSQEV